MRTFSFIALLSLVASIASASVIPLEAVRLLIRNEELGPKPLIGTAGERLEKPNNDKRVEKAAVRVDQRALAVVEAFRHAWTGYRRYAFPHDELHPVSNTAGDSRNGWGASAVDALSTAIIMGQTDIVDTILQHVSMIDFRKTSTEVSLFETTIRYLAGMLSGYDLLTGPFKGLTNHTDLVPGLLSQSKNLADTLKFAFDTPTGIPYNDLDVVAQKVNTNELTNGLATIGTLILEWTHLSDLLGDPSYEILAQRAESYLLNPKPASSEPFPGLVGTGVNISNGHFVDAFGGWVGGDDSFYEYLLKSYVYDPGRFAQEVQRWRLAADSTMKYLASNPEPRPDLTFVAAYNGPMTLINASGHLACFDGGNFILGGTVLEAPQYTNFGLALVEGCRDLYTSTATRIGPEAFSWNASAVPPSQQDFFERNGFWIIDTGYDLRPEVIESYYYAWRATNNTKYQDWVWDAFVAINSTTRTQSGFSSIDQVNLPGGGTKTDLQESFFFAEVLKYAYLTFASDGPYQFSGNGKNQFVFNTEAHPIKIRGGGERKEHESQLLPPVIRTQ